MTAGRLRQRETYWAAVFSPVSPLSVAICVPAGVTLTALLVAEHPVQQVRTLQGQGASTAKISQQCD